MSPTEPEQPLPDDYVLRETASRIFQEQAELRKLFAERSALDRNIAGRLEICEVLAYSLRKHLARLGVRSARIGDYVVSISVAITSRIKRPATTLGVIVKKTKSS